MGSSFYLSECYMSESALGLAKGMIQDVDFDINILNHFHYGSLQLYVTEFLFEILRTMK